MVPAKKDDGPNAFALKTTSRTEVLDESAKDGVVVVVDGSGKVVGKPYVRIGGPKDKELRFKLDQPPTDDLTLKVHFVVGQKEEEVKFDLKDVPLP